MSLKLRMVLAVAVAFALYGLSVCAIYWLMVLPRYARLEREEAAVSLDRCLGVTARELSFLARRVEEHASSPTPTSMASGVNLIARFDADGLCRSSKVVDLKNGTEIDLPGWSAASGLLSDRLGGAVTGHRAVEGIALTSRGPMLVAVGPVASNHGGPPSGGWLVMGRFLDGDLAADSEHRTHRKFSVTLLPDAGAAAGPPPFALVGESLSPSYAVIDSDWASMQTTLVGLSGQPVARMRVEVPRRIIALGLRAQRDALLLILEAGLVIVLVVLLFLRVTVQRRIESIDAFVSQVSRTRDLSRRVAVAGRDELSGLADGINRMLSILEKAEMDLREGEQRLDLAVSGADLGLWDRNIETGEMIVNERWAAMLGYTRAELRPHVDTWKEALHPDDLPEVMSYMAAHMSGRSPIYESEYRLRTKSGEWRWFLSRGKIVRRSADGRPLRISGTHLDITERKRAEERYRLLFSQMLNGFALHELICDQDGKPCDYRFLEINPAFERLTGMTAAEVVGKKVTEVIPGLELHWVETYAKVALTGEPAHFEDYSATLDRYYEITAFSPARGQFATIFRDITARKRAEEERQVLERRILHAQKLESLGVLAGGIAHDFNNLLMGILGNVELLRDDLPRDLSGRGFLLEIEKAGRRAADLCRQMLAYSGKGRFVVGPVSLNDMIHEMTHLLGVSISKKASLVYHLESGLPAVEGDGTQVHQVIMNLVINASEALGVDGGDITVSTGVMACDREYLRATSVHDELPDGPYVYLDVADTGCGMDSETVCRIFDPFFSTKFTGRGLGLAAVFGIVRGHGGTIRVDSVPGQGTTFRVLFPSAGQEAEVRARAEACQIKWHSSGTILLVDDEMTVLSVARPMLEGMGFTVLTALNGQQALDIFKARSADIDCIVLDLTMPVMDGEQTCEAVRRIKKDVPILLSSGYGEGDLVRRFKGGVPVGFLQKPYQRQALVEQLKRALGRAE